MFHVKPPLQIDSGITHASYLSATGGSGAGYTIDGDCHENVSVRAANEVCFT